MIRWWALAEPICKVEMWVNVVKNVPTIRHLCTLYPTSSILFFMAQYLPAVYSIDMPWPDLYRFTASFTRTVGKVFVHIDSWWAFLLKPGVCLFWQPISQAWVNRRGSSGRRAIPWSETAFNESQKMIVWGYHNCSVSL